MHTRPVDNERIHLVTFMKQNEARRVSWGAETVISSANSQHLHTVINTCHINAYSWQEQVKINSITASFAYCIEGDSVTLIMYACIFMKKIKLQITLALLFTLCFSKAVMMSHSSPFSLTIFISLSLMIWQALILLAEVRCTQFIWKRSCLQGCYSEEELITGFFKCSWITDIWIVQP